MGKVDVIIHSYGKPYHTLCTLKSLLLHSGQHIGKIYATEEKYSPYGDWATWAFKEIKGIDYYMLKEYYLTKGTMGDMQDRSNRWDYKYQYGIERSDKQFVFITHNDVLYHADIIGNMLSLVGSNAGIGLIGQCWNCPVFQSGKCDGERFYGFNPDYAEVDEIINKYYTARGGHFFNLIDKAKPMPLPECRLNEFACMIDRDITMKECYPNGNSRLFGNYDILDCGAAWFRDLTLKGYKFRNYDINIDCTHGYFSKVAPRNYNKDKIFYVSGHPTQLNQKLYWQAEAAAKEYYEQNFK